MRLALAVVALAIAPAARAEVVTLEQVMRAPAPPPSAPAWSPDGRSLAFLWEGPVPMVGRDGRGLRRLDAAGATDVKWLSSDALIAVRDGQLVALRAPAFAPAVLDERKGFEHLTVAPDGKTFAAVLDGDVWVFA